MPDIDYLSDGITESLINALSKIPRLRNRYAFAVAGAPPIRGRPTRVAAVERNECGRYPGRTQEKDLSEMLSLQEEISGDIAQSLSLKLSSGDKRRLAGQHTKSADAYQLYLKGRYHWSKWTEDGFRQAIACFEQALGKDPDFAMAYAGLGQTYGVLSYFNPDPAQAQGALLKSKAYTQRALEIDEALAEAHLLLGNIAHLHEWDWQLAEREFRLALELNPNLAAAHQGYSLFLMDQCKLDQALAEMELALQLDPLSLPVNTSMGFLLFNAGRYSDAIVQLRQSLQIDSKVQLSESDTTFQLSCQLLGACLEREGKYDEAIVEYLRMIPDRARPAEIFFTLRDAYARSGIDGFWSSFAGMASELSEKRIIAPLFVAAINASLGKRDEAFEWIEKAFRQRSPSLSHIKADPRFAGLHQAPRFAELLRRMGLIQ